MTLFTKIALCVLSFLSHQAFAKNNQICQGLFTNHNQMNFEQQIKYYQDKFAKGIDSLTEKESINIKKYGFAVGTLEDGTPVAILHSKNGIKAQVELEATQYSANGTVQKFSPSMKRLQTDFFSSFNWVKEFSTSSIAKSARSFFNNEIFLIFESGIYQNLDNNDALVIKNIRDPNDYITEIQKPLTINLINGGILTITRTFDPNDSNYNPSGYILIYTAPSVKNNNLDHSNTNENEIIKPSNSDRTW